MKNKLFKFQNNISALLDGTNQKQNSHYGFKARILAEETSLSFAYSWCVDN